MQFITIHCCFYHYFISSLAASTYIFHHLLPSENILPYLVATDLHADSTGIIFLWTTHHTLQPLYSSLEATFRKNIEKMTAPSTILFPSAVRTTLSSQLRMYNNHTSPAQRAEDTLTYLLVEQN